MVLLYNNIHRQGSCSYLAAILHRHFLKEARLTVPDSKYEMCCQASFLRYWASLKILHAGPLKSITSESSPNDFLGGWSCDGHEVKELLPEIWSAN